MEHFEFMFLISYAQHIQSIIARAESKGEVFHVSDNFCPLKSGCAAQALIRKLKSTDEKPVLILRVRGPKQTAVLEASSFFTGTFNVLPGDGPEYVFWNDDVPKSLTLEEMKGKLDERQTNEG